MGGRAYCWGHREAYRSGRGTVNGTSGGAAMVVADLGPGRALGSFVGLAVLQGCVGGGARRWCRGDREGLHDAKALRLWPFFGCILFRLLAER